MKNVTVSLDDAVYRQARRRAAEADRSLSAVVREFLSSYGAEESDVDRRTRRLREIWSDLDAQGSGLDAGGRLSRDELYERMTTKRSVE